MFFSEIDNALHCSFSNRLDGNTCSAFEQELLLRIAEFKNSRQDAKVIFDLDGVVFISSVFLRICLIHHKSFGKEFFSVTNVSEEVYKVFSVSGFAEMMNVVPLDQARCPEECENP